MLRTRVGYTGGEKDDPTYQDLGDHSEAIEIDFDPEVVSYEELLKIFWTEHDPCARSWSVQYRPAIYYHGDAQRRAAVRTRGALPFDVDAILTPIVPATTFHLAEDYHQKYTLQHVAAIRDELLARYPDDFRGFVDSTAAARLNGYLAGEGSMARLEEELPTLGLSPAAREEVRRRVRGRLRE